MPIPHDFMAVEDFSTRDRLSGTDPSGGFAYDLDLTVPHIATAIHAGHKVRRELAPLMAISSKNRIAEEDVATDRIIQGCPSTIWALDSRAEYDINRSPDLALPLTPEKFWGIQVYASTPTDAMNQCSLGKYESFYRFTAAVIKVLLDRFGACVVYDIHSYNIQRQIDKGHPSPPIFNLGTRGIDREKWKKPVTTWLEQLGKIKIPHQATTIAENGVFGGMGEFCRRLNTWDPRILVLPTEIAKIYMDKHSSSTHDHMVHTLKKGLAHAVAIHSEMFQRSYSQ
jgi:hypothetical protein